MWKPPREKSDQFYSVLLGLTFASLFIGQALTHILGAIFLISLLIFRPHIPWIKPFWWLVAFAAWEWITNYVGPHPGDGIEGGGISYHFLMILLPLCVPVIHYARLLVYISIGAIASSTLLILQLIYGVNLNTPPFRIDWSTNNSSLRPAGFNYRPWETQFIYSMVTLSILPYIKWKKPYSWFLFTNLIIGTLLPQIRGVLVGFITAISTQILFTRKTGSLPSHRLSIIKSAIAVIFIIILAIGSMAHLRQNFFDNWSSANNRNKVFTASIKIFTEHPITGIGGGKHFKEHYQQAWDTLEYPKSYLRKIGHAHNDYLMLLSHHGIPALFLWLGFIIHSLLFVWKNGKKEDTVIFSSLVIMHFIAGLMETYLDYGNTTYTFMLCYALALHRPISMYHSGSTDTITPVKH